MSFATNSAKNLSGIQKSLTRLQSSMLGTRKSAQSISKSLKETNIKKRRGIADSAKFFQMRRESVRRKEREDLVEASSSTGAIRRTGQGAMKSTKGFFGRIMDFLGNILIGWAVVNLPRIIKFAEGLTKRLQKYKSILDDFFGGTVQLFTAFGTGIGEIFNSITNLDFQNFKSAIDISLKDMNAAFSRMNNSVQQGIIMLSGDAESLLAKMGFDISDFKLPGEESEEDKPEYYGPGGNPDGSGEGQAQQGTRPTQQPTQQPSTQQPNTQQPNTQQPNTQQQTSGQLTNIVPLANLQAKNVYAGDDITNKVGMSSNYGYRTHPIHGGQSMHRGVDIATSNERGFHVAFGLTGTVSLVTTLSGYGKTVIINSGNLDFVFAHLANFDVRQGESYTGQIIGEIGSTGTSTGIHLQFEVRPKGGGGQSGIDPSGYIKYLRIGKESKNKTNNNTTNTTTKPAVNPQTNPQTSPNSNQNPNPLDNIFNLFNNKKQNQTRNTTISQPPTKKIATNTIIINGGQSKPPEPPQNPDKSQNMIPFNTASVNSSGAAKLLDHQILTKLG